MEIQGGVNQSWRLHAGSVNFHSRGSGLQFPKVSDNQSLQLKVEMVKTESKKKATFLVNRDLGVRKAARGPKN